MHSQMPHSFPDSLVVNTTNSGFTEYVLGFGNTKMNKIFPPSQKLPESKES